MAEPEPSAALFSEAGPDRYLLVSEASVALGAAWQVLQAFDRIQHGRPTFYDDDSRSSTLDYLRDGGEERPHAGIFAVRLYESYDGPAQTELSVLNVNGYGNETYRVILKTAVEAVGIAEPDATP